MPIFEFECTQCGKTTEILMANGEEDLVVCGHCGNRDLKRLISAHAAVSGARRFPTEAADRCCGSDVLPSSCEGPGSCCGRR